MAESAATSSGSETTEKAHQLSLEELLENGQRIKEETFKLLNDEENWEFVEQRGDLKLSKRQMTYWPGSCHRIETIVPCGLEQCFDLLYPDQRTWDRNVNHINILRELTECFDLLYPDQRTWDRNVNHITILRDLTEDAALVNFVMNSSFEGLVSPRDSVECFRFGRNAPNDHYWLTHGSVALDDEYPPEEGVIRAFVHPSGAIMSKIDEKKTLLKSVIQMDIKGWLPYKATEIQMPSVVAVYFNDLNTKAESSEYEKCKGRPGRKEF